MNTVTSSLLTCLLTTVGVAYPDLVRQDKRLVDRLLPPAAPPVVKAQPQIVKPPVEKIYPAVQPERIYRLDLRACKPEEKDFTSSTQTFGFEVYADKKTRRLFYVGAEGKAVAVARAPLEQAVDKPPKWSHRLRLPVRTLADRNFTDKTPKVSVDIYRDENSGNFVYVSHTGYVAVVLIDAKEAGKMTLEPKWEYGWDLTVRPYSEWDIQRYHKYSVEVYRDDNTRMLVYVAGNGAIAVLPAAKQEAAKKAVTWSHAMDLMARSPGEEKFTEKIRPFGVEVYQDHHRRAWVYLSEASQLAVVPAGKDFQVEKAGTDAYKLTRWLHAFRPAGDKGGKWSGEVFHNPNVGHLVYATSSGALAVAKDRTGLPPEK